jgi:hypothetical protein
MRRRTALALLMGMGALVLVGLAPDPASAAPARASQAACDPGDYPPQGPAIEAGLMITDGHLLPGTTNGTLTLSGATPAAAYRGTLFSPAVELAATAASSSGVVHYSGLTVPAGFSLSAQHHVDIYRDCTLVGQFTFCVTAQGAISSATSCAAANAGSAGKVAGNAGANGSLPKTGWDHAAEIVKIAVLAIALGVFLRYLQRRRTARARPDAAPAI